MKFLFRMLLIWAATSQLSSFVFEKGSISGFIGSLAIFVALDTILTEWAMGKYIYIDFDPKFKEEADKLVKRLEEIQKKEGGEK